MELPPGTLIQDRYEIRSLIGKGGMGEVYLTHDTQLVREVALKLLKKTKDEIKIKRFRQEARIVSALNHPNILSIYDFGKYEDFYFIISELIKGETLRKFIAHNPLTLPEALRISIQIGNALVIAHRSGITHRDLKPENIMILSDGHVKVLDFGLAKLTTPKNGLTQSPDESTASIFHTEEGLIAGTIYYMSPEQLRGQPIDERSDIWSLGVIFYELIIGRKPFTGDNNGDIIALILERPLSPITGINPQFSSDIENIFAKSLAKKREDRFQTVSDFVEALKIIKQKTGTRNPLHFEETAEQIKNDKTEPILSTNSQVTETARQTTEDNSPPRNTKNFRWYFLFIILLSVLGSGVFVYLSEKHPVEKFHEQLRIKRLTAAGNIINGVISPDGRFIAFVQNENGAQSLWIRQVDEMAAKELVPAAFVNYSGIAFSPDGNSIFFTLFAQSASGTLNRIPILGGSPQKIVKNVDSAVSFSPDGHRFAFIRTISNEGLDQIVVSNVDGTNERVLSQRKRPEFYSVSTRESLDWSPDGNFIACPTGKKDSSSDFMSLTEIDVKTGTERLITENKWYRIGRVIWSKNGEDLLITAAESGSTPFQVLKVSHLSGKMENVTHDLSDYFNISATNDFTRLLGIAFDKSSNIFISGSGNIEHARQVSGGGFDGLGGLSWTTDGKIVFTSTESGNRDIWMLDTASGKRQRLTFDESSEDYPVTSRDGSYILFVSSRTGTSHIWRMNMDGTDLKQLTDQADESFPQITPDSKWVIYSARTEGHWVLWKISIEGGKPIQLTGEQTHWAAISRDGKTVACLGQENLLDAPIKLVLVSVEDGKILNRFNLVGSVASPDIVPVLRWTPDNQAVAYIAVQNGVSNIYAQSVKGGEPKKITNFAADRIFSFDWSMDGETITFARGVMRNDLILIDNF